MGWKYESREIGQTIVTKMWEPIPDKEYDYDTGFTIDIVTNIAEAKQRPSAFAAKQIESLKTQGSVIEVYEPITTKGLVQSGLLIDQKMKNTDEEKDYRIRYVFIADEENELLYVLSFGTLVSQWEKYEPTFRTMSTGMKLIDLTQQNDPDK